MNDFMRMSEAAKLYGCNRARIYKMVKDGRLASQKICGLAVVSRAEVEALSAENAVRRAKVRGDNAGI